MLYTCWRFGGEHPAARWRVHRPDALALLPGPWPARVDAFMVACAMHAGQRERDLWTAIEALAGGGK